MGNGRSAAGAGGVDRREFLRSTSLTVLGASAALRPIQALASGGCCQPAGEAGGLPKIAHFVPAEKGLSPAYFAKLRERGASTIHRGRALDTIGMPIGGIAAGQLYLLGDGNLGSWQIFNRRINTGYGATNYQRRTPDEPVRQGFAAIVEDVDGRETRIARLDRETFPDVEFVGEYPIGRVRYAAAEFPVAIELEAFSPFIPLNENDSTLPATLFHITLTNRSDQPVRAGLAGWLENATLFHSGDQLRAVRRNSVRRSDKAALIALSCEEAPKQVVEPIREPIVLADFEQGGYGDWTVEGEAFGEKPAAGTLPNQNPVGGFEGAGLVNTFAGGDRPHGRATSPAFTIDRRYLNFLIGGGGHAGQTCINLLVGGKVVRTATGKNSEQLEWRAWNVQDLAGREARLEIVDQHSGGWGHINVDSIELADVPRHGRGGPLNEHEDFGTMALAILGEALPPDQTERLIARVPGLGDSLSAKAEEAYETPEKRTTVIVSSPARIEPGESRTVTALLSWHFPNQGDHGRHYATRFDDAADVADYVIEHHEGLSADTRLWHDTYYNSTLPYWLLDRLHSTVSNLATGTCEYWANGRFWAWEGVGCCEGTCTHVWNYEHALARLFPGLERSARTMQDLDAALHDSGLVGFRGLANDWYAADGQAGTILKCWREHQMSAGDAWLRQQWPRIRRAVEFLLTQDGNDDGLIENSQHNTYDINFFGPNTMVGSLYLGALRAAEEMAREAGDDAFARRCRRVFEAGSSLTAQRLFNGEYYVQLVDLEAHPEHQYGEGCLSDQLFGQGWAHQVRLGYLYPEQQVRQALESIWKYNWAPDIRPQNAAHPPERWFVSPGEAGLFTCTWPKSEHLEEGVRYRDEVWTGIEYQVAGHMVWEGMVDEALAMVRAIHDRYAAAKRNPWNEVECGDHYARALASWGVYHALLGFEHHGPKGHLGFEPRLTPEDFRAAFTTATGWGAYTQQVDERSGVQSVRIDAKWGALSIASLALAVPRPWKEVSARVAVNDQGEIESGLLKQDDHRVRLSFRAPVLLNPGEFIAVHIRARG